MPVKSIGQIMSELSTLRDKQLIIRRICAVAASQLIGEFDSDTLASTLDDVHGLIERYSEELKNIETLEILLEDEPATAEMEDDDGQHAAE